MKDKIVGRLREFGALLRVVPAPLLTFLVAAIVAMNLLANKSIDIPSEYFALDCGIFVSWIVFLVMDILTKHFGARAATELSVFALIINLLFCLIFFAASAVGGVWGESYVEGSEGVINAALDKTFGGSWFVVVGSSVAFVVSSVVNNFLNAAVGLTFRSKPDSLLAYLCRTYVSTAVGQFADNIVFAFIVSRIFFGWTSMQCLTCAATGMVAELLCEAVFAPLGYRVCAAMKRAGVGREYFALLDANREKKETGGQQ